MDIRSKFSFNIPEALIEALGITEDTPFVVSFEDGKLTVEPILDDNEESNDVTVDIESENDAWYEEGYEVSVNMKNVIINPHSIHARFLLRKNRERR